MEVWGMIPHGVPETKPLVRCHPEADDAFLFQRLIS